MLKEKYHPFFKGYNFLGFVHRGGAEEATENTLEAFQFSADMGFTFIETDIQGTKDGEVVVFRESVLQNLILCNVQPLDHSDVQD